jgi:hypothetical protein
MQRERGIRNGRRSSEREDAAGVQREGRCPAGLAEKEQAENGSYSRCGHANGIWPVKAARNDMPQVPVPRRQFATVPKSLSDWFFSPWFFCGPNAVFWHGISYEQGAAMATLQTHSLRLRGGWYRIAGAWAVRREVGVSEVDVWGRGRGRGIGRPCQGAEKLVRDCACASRGCEKVLPGPPMKLRRLRSCRTV